MIHFINVQYRPNVTFPSKNPDLEIPLRIFTLYKSVLPPLATKQGRAVAHNGYQVGSVLL